MKIANIILDPRFGGPQNRILQVAAELNRHGVDTLVITARKQSDPFCALLLKKNIRVKRMDLHRLTRDRAHLAGWALFFMKELLLLSLYLRREKIELVHCNSPWQIKGIIAGRLSGAKVVWHLNNTESTGAVKKIFDLLSPLCDGFIVAGEEVRKFYLEEERFRDAKIVEIQAPVNTDIFDPRKTRPHESLGKKKEVRIMTMGTINPTKRIDDFLEAAHRLNQRYNNLRFFVVGAELETQRKYYQSLMAMKNEYKLDNVLFTGPCNEIASMLKGIDIYVCQSESEASPMSVWEAMAMGKAIVSTDVGDVKRFIQDGKDGFVVPIRDVEKLAEKIGILVEDPLLRRSFGKRNRETAVRELDIKMCARKHRDFYREVLERPR